MTKPMEKVITTMLKELPMMASGSTTRRQVMECTLTLVAHPTRDNGEMIYSMDLEKRVGLMAPYTKVNMLLERNMVSDCTTGMMDLSIKENGMRIRLEDLEHTAG